MKYSRKSKNRNLQGIKQHPKEEFLTIFLKSMYCVII